MKTSSNPPNTNQRLNNICAQLCRICQELLLQDDIGPQDDFFSRGGNSILAIKFTMAIAKEFGVKIKVEKFFANPTILELAGLVAASSEPQTESLEHAEGARRNDNKIEPQENPLNLHPGRRLPLSRFQKKFWYNWQFRPDNSEDNYSLPYEIIGPLNPEQLLAAFKLLVKSHEVLRSIFAGDENGRAYIFPDTGSEPEIEISDGSRLSPEELSESVADFTLRPYNFNERPPCRLKLINITPERHIVVFAIHHIAIDGVVGFYLLKQWRHIYNRLRRLEDPGPISAVPFAEYIEQEPRIFNPEAEAAASDYLMELSRDIYPKLTLPYIDTGQPPLRREFFFKLGNEIVKQIKKLANSCESTTFFYYSSTFAALLFDYAEVGSGLLTYTINRRPAACKDLIAPFVDRMPLRFDIRETTTIVDLLRATAKQRRAAKKYQGCLFEDFVTRLRKTRGYKFDANLFNVGVNQAALSGTLPWALDGVQTLPLPHPKMDISLDLFLEIDIADAGHCRLTYNGQHFTAEFAEKFIEEFKKFIELTIKFPQAPLTQLLKFRRPAAAGSRNESPDLVPSHMQKRLWFLHKLEGEQAHAYNSPLFWEISGTPNLKILKSALEQLQERHEILRTIFPDRDGEPILVVQEPEPLTLEAEEIDENDIDRFMEDETRRAFDLERGPLFIPRLIKIREKDSAYFLVLNFHHIITDAWSLDIITRELTELYTAGIEKRPPRLPELTLKYSEFCRRQNLILESREMETKIAACADHLDGSCYELNLFPDKPGPETQSFAGAAGAFFIESDLVLELEALRKSTGLTPFVILLAAFGTLIRHYTGEDDILIGIPTAGREELKLQHLAGYFVNTIPVRLTMAGDPTFKQFLDNVREAVGTALSYQDVPIDYLIRKLNLERRSNRSPLIQVMFSLQEKLSESLQLPDMTLNLVLPPRRISIFNLTLELIPTATGMLGLLEYSTDLFNSETVSRITAHYVKLLQRIVKNPDARLSTLPEMTPAELRLASGENLRGAPLVETGPGLYQEISARCSEAPLEPALILEQTVLTRADLADRTRKLAAYLQKHGLHQGDHIGLTLARTIDLVPTLLALMKIGAVLVPLDPKTPKSRCHYILESAELKLLLTSSDDYAMAAACREADVPVINLEDRAANIASENGPPKTVAVTADDPLYIIYTSGSSGKPKGVLVGRRAFSNHCRACIKCYNLTPTDRVLQFAPIFFDAGLEQIFPALAAGATLVMRGENPWSAIEFHKKISDFQLTVLDLPPLYIKELLDHWNRHPAVAPRNLKHVLTGGEALPVEVAKQWLASPVGKTPLLNVYGPTEGVVTATIFRVHSSNINACATSAAPIGRPLPGRVLRILNENGKIVPPGVPGELCIGGQCLAEGYYNEPELTAQAFRFWSAENGGGWLRTTEKNALRLYRTGDRVRLTDYGVIEFLGRLDRQIKLRGFRIDPGEIEAGLCEQPEISRACVILQKDQSTDTAFLVAYIVVAAETKTDENADRLTENQLQEIRLRLQDRLPLYMVPQRLVSITEIPMTAAGKIDEKRLPRIALTRSSGEVNNLQRELSAAEQAVAEIWRELLQCGPVGPHDNFFDLGGHSLLILRLHARLTEQFGDQLEVVDLFRYPTVATQARALAGTGATHPQTAPAATPAAAKFETGEIAIIGMAGRLPGAEDLDSFWENLEAGVESITFFSRKELLEAGFSATQIDHPDFIAALGTLKDFDKFDAELFGFSPREASEMDPQHRLFLETAWHTLEHGGYDPLRYSGRIGVFAGCSLNSYLLNNLTAGNRLGNAMESYQLSMGNDKDFLPTKTSYKLNLRGPSLNINTACSTALTAIHTACKSLRTGECEMALAGGVSIQSSQISGHLYQANGIVSPDGHCRAFAEDAAGTVGGNGVGAVLLKPLAAALRDRDSIHAVIKGSALNNDGSAKVGFTAPGLAGQRNVILSALADAGVSAADISYVEAHGTGTRLGDPIEVKALTEAFRQESDQCGYCALGSVKSNIGHLDAAAGMPALFKTVAALKNRKIPATLHCQTPNPQLKLEQTPFFIPAATIDWDFGSRPRRAGISSFGMGGTNAHLIIEEGPATAPSSSGPGPWIFPFSAHTRKALDELIVAMGRYFAAHPDLNPADISYTLAQGRSLQKYRSAVICRSLEEAASLLQQNDSKRIAANHQVDEPLLKHYLTDWLTGKEVNWQTLFSGQERTRLPLPLYPFQRQRYWIDPAPAAAAANTDSGNPAARTKISDWFSVPSWHRAPAPRSREIEPAPLIILHTGSQVELQILKYLEPRFSELISFELDPLDNDKSDSTPDPLVTAGLETIFKQFSATSRLTILHLALLPSLARLPARMRLQYVKKMALTAVINLLETLNQSAGDLNTELIFIASELYQVQEDDIIIPEKLLVNGPAQVIPQEYRNLECRIFDLKLDNREQISAKNLALLELELAGEGRCRRTAFRNQRWEADFSRLNPARPAPAESWQKHLRDNGVYLINGGRGGIGLTLADAIVNNCRNPKIALLARSPLPERKLWSELLQKRDEKLNPADNELAAAAATSEIIRKIIQWEEQGATIITPTADVADSRQLQTAITRINRQFGPIHGLIHAAGVAGGKLIPQTDERELERVLRPKVDAILNLARIIDLGALDFTVFCSSLNSVLGGIGQLAYCAANAFLDAMAISCRGRGRVISIAWDSWKEVGMAVGALRAATKKSRPLPPVRSYPMDEIINTQALSPATDWAFGEHQIDNHYVLPGVAYLDLAYSSLDKSNFNSALRPIGFTDFTLLSPLSVTREKGGSSVNLRIGISRKRSANSNAVFAIHSADRKLRGNWIEHVQAQIHQPPPLPPRPDLENIKKRCRRDIAETSVDLTQGIRINAGRRWDFPVKAGFGQNEALAFMELPADLNSDLKFKPLHPALLDRATAFMLADFENGCDFMPFQFGSVDIYAPLTPGIISYSRYLPAESSAERLVFDITIMAPDGRILIEIKRYCLRKVAGNLSLSEKTTANSAPPKPDQTLKNLIANGISSAEGVAIFADSLEVKDEPVIYICTTGLDHELKRARSQEQNLELSALITQASAPTGTRQARPEMNTPFKKPTGTAETLMAKIWSELLGFARIGVDDDLFELGADSLIALQALSRFTNEFGVRLSIDRFFAAPTIAELCAAAKADETKETGVTQPSLQTAPTPEEFKPTPRQQSLWLLEQQIGPNPVYNLPIALKFKGELNITALRDAFSSLTRRHQALTTIFQNGDNGPLMKVLNDVEIPFHIEDISPIPEPERTVEFNLRVKKELSTPFQLNQGLLCRARLLIISPREYGFIITCHHIIVDGWSIGIMIEELTQLYQANLKGVEAKLPARTATFSDFVAWQNRLLNSDLNKREISFWREKLKDMPEISSMPSDRARPARQSFAGDSISFKISPALTARLKLRAQEFKTPLNNLLTTAFGLLISGYAGQKDIVIGTAMANRSPAEFATVVGLLAHIMPLRLDFSGEKSFAEQVQQTAAAARELVQHSRIPFERLLDELEIKREASHHPGYQTYFTLLPPLSELPQSPGLQQEWLEFKSEIAKFEFSLYMEERNGGLYAVMEFATALFAADSVKGWIRSFLHLLKSVAESGDRPITETQLISFHDRKRLAKWGKGETRKAVTTPLVERIKLQVIEHPNAPAIISAQGSLTYAELERFSDIVRESLQDSEPAEFIGICMERSATAVAAMLAVLKNNSAFIPFDPTQPEERLRFMIRNARLKKILVTDKTCAFIENVCRNDSEKGLQIINIEALPRESTTPANTLAAPAASAYNLDHPAYVIYTSGSTGQPKGVVVPHRGLLNLIDNFSRVAAMSNRDRIAQTASLAFDASIIEIWPGLCSGVCLHLVPQELLFDPPALRDWIIEQKISISPCSTAIMEMLLQLEWPERCELKMLYTGGDTLRVRPAPGLPFKTYNMYGPTENSVTTTGAFLTSTETRPPEIGKPFANIGCHLLRRSQDSLIPVPPGAPAELCISGRGLATGYLNDPERTAKNFLYWSPTTFKIGANQPDAIRIYKTGDHVRYRQDGNLEFIGRIDNQVKIRGFRIELGEIEQVLKRHAGVRDAVVITHGNTADNKRLAAFIIYREGKTVTDAKLLTHLQTLLPTYMIPADITAVESWPLLTSGKIDRRALSNLLNKPRQNRGEKRPLEKAGRTAFMFTGQGVTPVVSRELFQEPQFKKEITSCAEILAPYLGLDIIGLLRQDLSAPGKNSGNNPTENGPLSTRFIQPLLFAFEYALARMVIGHGIVPDIMIGHSIGEWVAATIAEVFSLEESLKLICKRGELMAAQPPGRMLAIPRPESEVLNFLENGLSLAAVNTPEQTVVSGPQAEIDQLAQVLQTANIQAVQLATTHAFHSEMMAPAMAGMAEAVSAGKRATPKIPFISNLTGKLITDEQAGSPEYWARHLRETVRFSDGLETLLTDKNLALLEIGPQPILVNLARRSPAYTRQPVFSCIDPVSDKSFSLHLEEIIKRLKLQS